MRAVSRVAEELTWQPRHKVVLPEVREFIRETPRRSRLELTAPSSLLPRCPAGRRARWCATGCQSIGSASGSGAGELCSSPPPSTIGRSCQPREQILAVPQRNEPCRVARARGRSTREINVQRRALECLYMFQGVPGVSHPVTTVSNPFEPFTAVVSFALVCHRGRRFR